MWNTMKSVLRQTLHDTLGLIVSGVFLVMLAVNIGDMYDYSFSGVTGSDLFGALLGRMMTFLLPVIVMSVTARVCGWDLEDHTANYEILFGKKRAHVFFGRFLPALGLSAPW